MDLKLDGGSVPGLGKELRDRKAAQTQSADSRQRRVSFVRPGSVLVALDTWVHKVHRNRLTAVTQWISCLQRKGGGSQELPGKGGLALTRAGHGTQQVCRHWTLKAPKHWAQVHKHLQAKPCQPHMGEDKRKRALLQRWPTLTEVSTRLCKFNTRSETRCPT